MGERFRLKKDFDSSKFSPEVQAILNGLKKYGMFVADNGIDWAISVAPEPRIKNLHDELRKIKGSDPEVVETPAGYQPPEEWQSVPSRAEEVDALPQPAHCTPQTG